MGRNRKYHTKEEKKAARARDDAKYYERNKHSISKKAALRYDRKVIEREKDIEHRPVVRKNTRRPGKSLWSKSQTRIVENQVQALNEVVGPSLHAFGETLYLQAMEDDYLAPEQLEVKINEIRDIELVATNTCDCVWEAEGATDEWRHMTGLKDSFRQVLSIVTQLWDLTVSDPFHTQDLESARREGKLVYQSI